MTITALHVAGEPGEHGQSCTNCGRILTRTAFMGWSVGAIVQGIGETSIMVAASEAELGPVSRTYLCKPAVQIVAISERVGVDTTVEAEQGFRYCVHGRVPLGDWCRQCNPLRR